MNQHSASNQKARNDRFDRSPQRAVEGLHVRSTSSIHVFTHSATMGSLGAARS
jgi:hypothetical protein